ncbi:MAG: TIGR00725 family protein [Bradymonadales bacterium]|nr:TIGR00725 family protein [Bradymonadales bacterium]
MNPRRPKIIGVVGGSSPPPEAIEAAFEVGREIARLDLWLVSGGLSGVMAAASRGVREGRTQYQTGSFILGILPGDKADNANPYVDLAIPTGLGIARNLLVVRTADAIVAIDGESGTLSEVAFAWQLGKPIVALTSTGGWAAALAGKTIDSRRSDRVHSADSPEEAVRRAVELLSGRSDA